MMLAGTSTENVLNLIGTGVSADYTFPRGKGYMISTTDELRSVRHVDFSYLHNYGIYNFANGALSTHYVDNSSGTLAEGNAYENRNDMLFYFTGLTHVPDIDTNTFLPGAVADHLTSFGGQITITSGQMKALRWLEAGATASFGTVVEPCNFRDKFPVASTFIRRYYEGNTVLEAYWKSVAMPGEGLFIGEPLAKPYGTRMKYIDSEKLLITSSALDRAVKYTLRGAQSSEGPFDTLQENIIAYKFEVKNFEVPAIYRYYELIPANSIE